MNEPTLPYPDWAPGLIAPDAWAVLVAEVEGAARAAGLAPAGPGREPGSLRLLGAGGEEAVLFLRNFARLAAASPPSRWPELARDFVAAAAPGFDPESAPSAQTVRLRLAHRDIAASGGELFGPWAGELGVALAIDLPLAIAHLSIERTAGVLGVSRDELRELGLANLRRALAPRLVPIEAPGRVRLRSLEIAEGVSEGWRASGLLLLDELGLEADAGALIAAPSAELVALAPLADEPEPAVPLGLLVSSLLSLRDAPIRPLSTDLFWWSGAGIEPIRLSLGEGPGGDPVALIGIGPRLATRHPSLAFAFLAPGDPEPARPLRPN